MSPRHLHRTAFVSVCALAYGLALTAQTPATQLKPDPGTTAQTQTAQTTTQVASTKDDDTAQLAHQLATAGEEAGSTDAAASTNGEGPAGIVPFNPGFNASLGTTSQHDAAAGWQSILTPNLAWRFNRHFSVNVGLPVYAYINTSVATALKTVPVTYNYSLATQHFILGDTTIATEFEAHPKPFDYNVTVSLGTPTGDDANGLGAGQVTYTINNHFEHFFTNYLLPELELGIGNSPNLDNERVRKSYVDVGTNAHFQFGFGFVLPRGINFTTSAYEELPLGTQTITSQTTNGKKGKQLRIITTTSEKSIGEDNGFLNTLDIPLNDHVIVSGFYNRSLRNKDDIAGFSFTFTLRKTPHTNEEVH